MVGRRVGQARFSERRPTIFLPSFVFRNHLQQTRLKIALVGRRELTLAGPTLQLKVRVVSPAMVCFHDTQFRRVRR